ncbi:hypothetical protein Kisp02_02650 [Kineosporia sp. NBRC 101731]|nr:hypothetical protein Kisp02_02650 [Kineosporia sp. NBRC 101731]
MLLGLSLLSAPKFSARRRRLLSTLITRSNRTLTAAVAVAVPTEPGPGLPLLRVQPTPTQTGLRGGPLPTGDTGLTRLLRIQAAATQAVTSVRVSVGPTWATTGWTRRTFHDGRCPPVSVRPEAFVRLTDRSSVRRPPACSQIRR